MSNPPSRWPRLTMRTALHRAALFFAMMLLLPAATATQPGASAQAGAGGTTEGTSTVSVSIATVLGEPVFASDGEAVWLIVLVRLRSHFAKENQLAASEEEIERYRSALRYAMAQAGQLLPETGLTPAEMAQAEAVERDEARDAIVRWKVNRALYYKYGGRLMAHPLGPVPVDAQQRLMEDGARNGDFAIHDPAASRAFWQASQAGTASATDASDTDLEALNLPPWDSFGVPN